MPKDLLLLDPAGQEKLFGPACLLVAIDETGHEQLADPRYPLFGLGGCLTVVADYHKHIHGPWTALKDRHFGGGQVPLHATGLMPSPEQAAALGSFFKDQTFGRFAAIATDQTDLSSPLSRYESVALVMGKLIDEVATHYHFDRIAVVFEHNQRTEPLIRRVFSSTKTYPDRAKKWQVPTQFFLASKQTAEPLVEVADFVMQAAGTATRAYNETGVPPLKRRDFGSVFEGGSSRRAAFTILTSIHGPKPSGGTA
jgi:hypothetical protein